MTSSSLSPETINGLTHCFATEPLSAPRTLEVLCELAISLLLNENCDDAIAAVKSLEKKVDAVSLKASVASLTTLALEGAKQGIDGGALRSWLDESQINDAQFKVVSEAYDNAFERLRVHLSKAQFGFPSLSVVDWRLDYYMKSSVLDRTNEPVYIVRLHARTEDGGAHRLTVARRALTNEPLPADETDAAKNVVEFACTRMQLQDLVDKLKDAVKQIERSAEEV